MSDEQYRRELRNLFASKTPLGTLSDPEASDASFLAQITVGGEFHRLVDQIVRDIWEMPRYQTFRQHIVVGTFGSGKTHMALTLYHHLKDHPDQLVSTFDFSTLNGDPELLEYLIITGLRWEGHYGYQRVCSALLERIAQKLNFTFENQTLGAIKAVLFATYRHLVNSTEGWSSVVADALERGLGDEIKDSLRNGTLTALIEKYKTSTTYGFVKFIEALSDLAANPDAYSGPFEAIVRDLSAAGQLVDIMFKLLKFAGFERVIIMGDELEALEGFGEDLTVKVLTQLRGLVDECAAKTNQEAYPATAFVFFATHPFLTETVQFVEPGLWRRWEYDFLFLPDLNVEEAAAPLAEFAEQIQLVNNPIDLDQLLKAILQDQERLTNQNRPYVMSNLIARLFTELRKYQ